MIRNPWFRTVAPLKLPVQVLVPFPRLQMTLMKYGQTTLLQVNKYRFVPI